MRDAAKIGDGPQLLVDDYLVAESRGLRKVFHPARKVTDGPILSPDRPYEGHSILLDNSARYNPEENRYELTYRHVNYDQFRYHMLAVSEDLRTWTKPDLGRVEHDGSRANNILARMDVTKPGDLFPVFAGVLGLRAPGESGPAPGPGCGSSPAGRPVIAGPSAEATTWSSGTRTGRATSPAPRPCSAWDRAVPKTHDRIRRHLGGHGL